MNDLAIETVRLCTARARRASHGGPALEQVDLRVPAGGVHGLLGPHGAGTTTLLRVLVGLARPDAGQVRVLGAEVPRELPRVMPRVGALVGGPRFQPHLTGRRNLQLLARAGGVPDGAVEPALERVGLTGRAGDRFRRYPPAAAQRLALAAALLKRSELVLLDEPARGLDRGGERLVAELVRELAADGVTVLLATHSLAEVQRLCDTVTVLDGGRVTSSGRVAELVGRDPGDGVWVGAADLAAAAAVLTAGGLRVTREGPMLYVEGAADPSRVTRLLADRGIYLRELVPDRPDLEATAPETSGRASGGGHR